MINLNEKYGQLANQETINKTVAALEQNGIKAVVVDSGQAAKNQALEIIPEGEEVMNMTSVTIETIGLDKVILESGRFRSVRQILSQGNGQLAKIEKQRLGAAHEWVIGSVHAITEQGQIMVASATGSQLPAYAYGAFKVLWIAGAQKIVKNLDEGFKRIYKYTFPLENERALKAYGMGSGVNKILIINKEFQAGRINVIIVKEKIGF